MKWKTWKKKSKWLFCDFLATFFSPCQTQTIHQTLHVCMITTITTKIQMNYDEWTPQLQWHPNRYSVHLSQHVLLLCIRTNNFPLLFCMEMILLRVAATCFCKQPQNSMIKKRTNRFHVILIFMFFLGYKGNVVIVVSRQYTEICFNRTISNGMLIIYFRHKMCPTTHEQAWLITVGVLSVVGAV